MIRVRFNRPFNDEWDEFLFRWIPECGVLWNETLKEENPIPDQLTGIEDVYELLGHWYPDAEVEDV